MSYANDDKKFSTYAELRDLLKDELDLYEEDPAEEFVTRNELISYYNDGILDARAEILNVYEDYFLTSRALTVVANNPEIDLPKNIWADKIRAILYQDGAIRYPIKRIKNYNKFDKIMWGSYAQNNDPWYAYYIKDSTPGEQRLVFLPTPQFSTTDALLPNPFQPVLCWYLRQCNRIPLFGEYAFRQRANQITSFPGADIMIIPADLWVQVQTGGGIKITMVTTGGVLPTGIVTTGAAMYIVKQGTSGQIKLATTKQNALANTTVTIGSCTDAVINFTFEANQNLIDNTVVDLPEFSNFLQAWVRVRVCVKQKDPDGIQNAKDLLSQAREQMVSSLTQKVPDDDNLLEGDFSFYEDSSGWLPGMSGPRG